MTYLLWGLLNLGIFLFFIVVCFQATKLIREKIGLFASIVFVFGLLSFMGQPGKDNNKEPTSNQMKTWKFASPDSLKSNDSHILNMTLEKTMLSKYDLGIVYGKDNEGQSNIPISAYSSTTGFIIGTNWQPTSIIVNRTSENNKFAYLVKGIVEWKLLGATLYSQVKEYNGIALTK